MKVIKTKIDCVNSHILLDIASVHIDDVLPFNIFIKRDNEYVIIIEAGTLLSEKIYNMLTKQENLYIDKKDEDKRELTCETLKFHIKHNKNNIEKKLQLLYDVNNQLFSSYMSSKDNQLNMNCVASIVNAIVMLIKFDEKVLHKTMPYFVNNHETPDHSLHVAFYAINIGNRLNMNTKQLLQLGTAALLHDIGYKKVPAAIFDKETYLTPKESEQMSLHCQYGVDVAIQNKIRDSYIIDAIRHHHERYDGSGYPGKLSREDISEYASILAISDVFDALTSNRPHRKASTSFNTLKMMMKDPSMQGQFNKEYLHLFLKSL